MDSFRVVTPVLVAIAICAWRILVVGVAIVIHPCKPAVMSQYWASSGPMMPASAQYRPSSGMCTGRCAGRNISASDALL